MTSPWARKSPSSKPAEVAESGARPANEAVILGDLTNQLEVLRQQSVWSPPSETRADGTGLKTKAALATAKFFEELTENCKEGAIIFFADCDNMRAGNDNGFRDELTALKHTIPASAAMSLGGKDDYRLLQAGGDEFPGYVSDTGGLGLYRLKAFKNTHIARLRELLPDSPQLRHAEFDTEIRVDSKALIGEILAKDSAITPEALLEVLQSRFGSIRGDIPAEDRVPQVVGEIAPLLGSGFHARWETGQRRIMNISVAGIRLKPPYTEERFDSALIQAQQLVSEAKKLRIAEVRVVDFDESRSQGGTRSSDDHRRTVRDRIRMLDGQHLIVKTGLETLTDSKLWKPLVRELIRLSAVNHSHPNNLRFDLLEKQSAGDLFQIDKPTTFYPVSVKLSGIKALNAEIGYERTDEVVAKVMKFAEKAFPDAIRISIDGDGLVCWADKPLRPTELQDLKRWLKSAFAEALGGLHPEQRIRAEVQHLWTNGERRRAGPSVWAGESKFGEVTLSSTANGVRVSPADTIAFAQSKFNQACKRVLSLQTHESR